LTIDYGPPPPDEAEIMGQLHSDCWLETYAGLMAEEEILQQGPAARARLWRQIIADDSVQKLVAYDAGRPVGFVVSGAARPPASAFADGEIRALYLRHAYHGRGIGRHLLDVARDDWARRSGQRLVALVLAGNNRGRQFYARMGGKEVGSEPVQPDGRGLVEIACVFDVGSGF
jgi:GNAT superfamily N-acetyltransferase